MEKYLEAADRAIAEAARSPRSWARITNPAPDAIPAPLRKPTFPARDEPVKRIGRPAPAAPVVEDPEVATLRRAREILRAFADRAFRRPATADELGRLVSLVESARKDGDAPNAAIRHALKAVLISPSFLFHVEEEPEAGGDRAGTSPRRVRAGRPAVLLPLEQPARRRALPDRRPGRAPPGREPGRAGPADAPRREGRGPWSRTASPPSGSRPDPSRTITPDPSRTFPDFDEPLRRAMIEEVALFAGSIIREDRDVLAFLDADYTFVNERLARHYGIPGVDGERFRRVSLAGTHRGGVATMAGVLTATSNPTRTSPVKRGKWVLDNLLGMPPPPPPDGVEGLKADGAAGHPGTLRQEMERHRSDPRCASCHSRMDPLGFGLEDFDGIGARRSAEGGSSRSTSPGRSPGAGRSGARRACDMS